ncbi:type IV pilus modification PilV family protein [Clostridium tagluense]|uniref:Prepilin-type N-terminal cleavage/methylation domain-containing protein n=1 Tax=Clostridium tagluense TaxID=360422 RepID=A0A401URZ7_9CLOT|nr:prepilin-type N-terminal cleavage/methylation domain-containing protein [Clostridium tagluense]GCD12276.1 hypothetical protein Ctaglu_38990 [Clostridium tagluense]
MKFKKNKGITLIEVIISLAILGIIITPILSMTLTTVKISKSSEDKVFATSLAQQCTEYIKSEDIKLLDFLKIGLVENNDNELKKLMKNDNGDITPFKLYTLSEKPQNKNIVTKIKYDITTTNNNSINDSKTEPEINIVIDENNKVLIKDNIKKILYEGKTINIEGVNPIIKINKKVDENMTRIECNVKQGEETICEGIVNKPIDTANSHDIQKKIDITFKSSSKVKVDVYVENENKDESLRVKLTKNPNSNFTYNVIENEGIDAKDIIIENEILSTSNQYVNPILSKCNINIEIWNYDSKKNTKVLLQEVKTSKVL